MRKQLECTCEKDPNYSFGCRNAVMWFAENVLIMKIRRLQRDSDKVLDVQALINTEYLKCKQQYNLLKKLTPKQESV